ncbi:MAG: PhoX family protein [Tagaea sp.]
MTDFEDDPETFGVERPMGRVFGDIAAERLSRRALLGGAAAAGLAAALPAEAQTRRNALRFTDATSVLDANDHWSPGYKRQVVVRWGDPIFEGAPEFDPRAQTGAKQERQFGYNNDFMWFFPLPYGSKNSTRGLLHANHEYCNGNLMFPGIGERGNQTKEQCEVEMAAHGLTTVEIAKTNGKWEVVKNSRYNRRLSVSGEAFMLTGPAAGHPRLRSNEDRTGTIVMGTLNNCAGGVTPWGTVLSGEENFNGYFGGDASRTPEARNHRRYGVSPWQGAPWANFFERFQVEKNPNEPNRFGWVVEYDPYDPRSTPVKRTALGRFKHEGATCVVCPDGRVAVYSGDDERFEYVYRFVTRGKYDPKNRRANRDLLDDGTLSVARFDADGTVRWIPLVHGQGPLTAANGFESQADILIETRCAADLLGATPMDRPEDVETDPVTGRTYIMCTYNERRAAADAADARTRVNPANPRVDSRTGHIVEMIPPGGRGAKADHAADVFRWDIFLLAGDPADPAARAKYGPGVGPHGWLAAPDNVAFDPRGRMWIATDGMPTQVQPPRSDGIFGAEIEGPGRAVTKRLYGAPSGAEVCGPCFTPDGKTLFLAIQHPGEARGSNYENPSTRWPDFRDGWPPRPAVIALEKEDGGEIGS